MLSCLVCILWYFLHILLESFLDNTLDIPNYTCSSTLQGWNDYFGRFKWPIVYQRQMHNQGSLGQPRGLGLGGKKWNCFYLPTGKPQKFSCHRYAPPSCIIHKYIYTQSIYIYIICAKDIHKYHKYATTNSKRKLRESHSLQPFCTGDVVQAAVTGRLGRQLKIWMWKWAGPQEKGWVTFQHPRRKRGFSRPPTTLDM